MTGAVKPVWMSLQCDTKPNGPDRFQLTASGRHISRDRSGTCAYSPVSCI